MSRPKKEVTRSEVVRVKFTKEEKEKIKEIAELRGMSMSELIRKLVLPKPNAFYRVKED